MLQAGPTLDLADAKSRIRIKVRYRPERFTDANCQSLKSITCSWSSPPGNLLPRISQLTAGQVFWLVMKGAPGRPTDQKGLLMINSR